MHGDESNSRVLSQRPVKVGRRKQIIHESKLHTRADERKKGIS